MDIPLVFLLAGVMLILGFLGDYLFKRTGVPDILILIFLGFLLGPVFNIIDVDALSVITPIFASLALLIILFDGGLHMDLYRTIRGSPRAMTLAFLGVIVSMFLVAGFMMYFFNWSLLTGLLLGAIVGGTSSAIVIPLVSRLRGLEHKITTLLSLESVFTDALVVVIGITLIQLVAAPESGNEFSLLFTGITSQFSIGIVVGIVVGLLWLRVLRSIKGSLYDDVFTLAVVLLFFAVVQSLGGSGAIFALTFGLVLANGYIISKMLKSDKPVEATGVMKKFQAQISFLIRTFFFVYLGLIITFRDINFILVGIALAVLLFAGRYVSVLITSIKNPVLSRHRSILTFMLPRGLAAAVVAQIVVSSGLPEGAMFSDIVITVIIATVAISSIGSFLAARSHKPHGNQQQKN